MQHVDPAKLKVSGGVTRADLDHLIGWLEQHPKNKVYEYGDSANCLNAQYHRHIGKEYGPDLGVMIAQDNIEESKANISTAAEYIACQANKQAPFWVKWVRSNRPSTFGKALEIARQYRDEVVPA